MPYVYCYFFSLFNLIVFRPKEEKCTKAQSCSSGICIWNQRIIFFDIETFENIVLWVKLINLEHNQEILGEMKLNKLNLNNKCEWFSLNDVSQGLFNKQNKMLEIFFVYI